MQMTMSMFASSADYWKFRAELAETTVRETAEALGCEPDNESMLDAAQGAVRYRWLAARLLAADFDYNGEGVQALVFELPNGCAVSADCDATIDAAMLAAPAVGAA